jgi:hypothetical protein
MRLLPLLSLAATALAVPATPPITHRDDGVVEHYLVRRQGRLGGKTITMLFARGTTEPGTMGSTVGPALSRALSAKYPGTKAEGVSYPADISGAFSGGTNPKGAAGSTKMAAMAKSALAQNHLVVLSGYSTCSEAV